MAPSQAHLTVRVTRGALTESVHAVLACAVNDAGDVLLRSGDQETPIFLRSAAKPLIAAAVIRSGAAARFGLTDCEIAIIAGSHAGEPYHIRAVLGLLHKIGLDSSALACGAVAPSSESAARDLVRDGRPFERVHNNCSGKHAGILALALASGGDPNGYCDPSHPAQRAIEAMYARMFAMAPEALQFGIDGCGIPTVAVPLSFAAHAFARLASLRVTDEVDLRALERVRTAMLRYPQYVRGFGALDTELMRASNGRIVAKAGAEGVFAVAERDRGLGLIVKVTDGATRAVAPAVLGCLRKLDIGPPVDTLESAIVRNAGGTPVGTVAARFGAEPVPTEGRA